MSKALEQLEGSIRGLITAYKMQAVLQLLKAGAITPASLEAGGKLNPARGLPGGSGINPPGRVRREGSKITVGKDNAGDDYQAIKVYVPILKVDSEKREVTGVVLKPEEVDAQGDIMSPDVIEKAAGDFLAGFNRSTTLGLMHKDFTKRFGLRQSFVAPIDMVISNKTVKAGTWLMVVKVIEDNIWKQVKDGKLTGFSIGGRAKVKKLAEE